MINDNKFICNKTLETYHIVEITFDKIDNPWIKLANETEDSKVMMSYSNFVRNYHKPVD